MSCARSPRPTPRRQATPWPWRGSSAAMTRGRHCRRRRSSPTRPSSTRATCACGPSSTSSGLAELHYLTVAEAHDLLARRQISAVELTRAVLDRIGAVDERLKAYVTVTSDLAPGQ